LFEYQDFGHRAVLKNAQIEASNGNLSKKVFLLFNVELPTFRAKYEKSSLIKFDKSRPIETYIDVEGPFYTSQIYYDPPSPTPQPPKSLRSKEGDSEAELKIQFYQIEETYSLDAEVRFYLDDMSMDWKKSSILGYTFYEPSQTTMVSLYTASKL
jgi:hypothetical protein